MLNIVHVASLCLFTGCVTNLGNLVFDARFSSFTLLLTFMPFGVFLIAL